ncbi:hypothetical protein SAMN02982990_03731 [Photorhabdus luminescens]|uniref:DUF7424 domain-containing protein n=2 Tax=Morganellaceae TaxID=1903414 RepID=A0A1G5RBG0_PHOLU|nr:hypothetical protein SAMN02982990_03731 [Photorhabdus luminescens]
MRKLILCSVMALALAGCKTELSTSVSVNQLLSEHVKTVASDLLVEVSACGDYKDSRQSSKSLLDAQEKVPAIFADAEYVECFRKGMDSFAHFKIPVSVGNSSVTGSTKGIHLYGDGTDILAISIPKEMKKKINQMDSSMASKTKISINVKNDTDKVLKITGFSVFLNDKEPIVISNFSWKVGSEIKLTLSNVSVASALDERFDFTPVLMATSE